MADDILTPGMAVFASNAHLLPHRALLRLADGREIETVARARPNKWSAEWAVRSDTGEWVRLSLVSAYLGPPLPHYR